MDTFYDEKFENKADVDYLLLLINEGTKSEDLKVREIYQNIINIKKIEPRFQLFLSVKTGSSYMHQFKALNINKNDLNNYLTVTHEYGHAMFDIVIKQEMPENYPKILENAKKSALNNIDMNYDYGTFSVRNGKFRNLLEFICDKNNIDKLQGLGPLSDIISAMWQATGFNNSQGDPFFLPFSHTKNTYVTDDNTIKYDKVFDEQFANFFALKSTNSVEALNVIKVLFGNEWYNAMEETIEKIYNFLNDEMNLKK